MVCPREGASQARRSRSLRVLNLPPGTQEGLLQQTLEKHAKVRRIEVFLSKNEAVVELASVSVSFIVAFQKRADSRDNFTGSGKALIDPRTYCHWWSRA